MLDVDIQEYYIDSQEIRNRYIDRIERIILKTDSYHQDQVVIEAATWRDKTYRSPMSGEWSDDRFLFTGVDENRKRYFGKQIIRLPEDHYCTITQTVEYNAQMLLLLGDMAETPNLVAWWEDTVIMTTVHGITIRQAYFNGWLTKEWLSDHLPRILWGIGRVRDRLNGYQVAYDCSVTNVLITKGGQVSFVDFDPANRPTEILTFTGLLINLALGTMIFNKEGKLVYADKSRTE